MEETAVVSGGFRAKKKGLYLAVDILVIPPVHYHTDLSRKFDGAGGARV